MGVYTRPNIITNGLVLNLDAANIKSYPGSGTAWRDLSGNNNTGTLTNGPTFSRDGGGSIVFNGTNQYVDCGNNSIINTAVNTCTINVWFRQSTTATYRSLTSKGPSDADENFQLAVSHANSKLYFDVGNATYIDTTYSYSLNTWYNICVTHNRVAGTSTLLLYVNGINIPSTTINPTLTPVTNSSNFIVGSSRNNTLPFPGNIADVNLYNRALSASEILQNYNALKSRFEIGTPVSSSPYETLTYLATGTITITNNGTDNVNMFKTSGANAWDSHFYSTTPFTAPCTIEFNKQAGATDNGVSYAMIGWNVDPTLDASYTSLDYASYPYATNTYQVYNNGTAMNPGTTWNTANKIYVVYDTDGYIRHYNGSTLIYSVNYGTGKTVYVDSSFYSVNATYGGFSNVRVRRNSWNGTAYV